MGWIEAFIGRILSTQNRFWLVDKMSNWFIGDTKKE